jgi:UDP-GlcNAc:undecaprenyl-phosphate GlcNAc-1-phosphate transferase
MALDLGFALLILILSMSISMAVIPVMIRLAPVLGMMDKPDSRKVHATPIPRVGGIGIVLGALIPLLIWPVGGLLLSSFLFGAMVLLVFGAWDDAKELGHYVKFIGQFIAVLAVVYVGDLYVTRVPFLPVGAMGEMGGRIFTVIAMVGMINAINHSDGLDGLAGGESLLSLAAMLYLGFQVSDPLVMLVCVSTIGGVFGFLRFNSHPARVFMGDGGSQFLGFALGFLVVYVTQVSNTALSPALPALLLGLPVVDIIAVLIQRVSGGMNWFRATKNHIHHRLLALGFEHYESVMVIYSVQALLVVSAVLMPYESDQLILAVYLGVTAAVFGSLYYAEKARWRLHVDRKEDALSHIMAGFSHNSSLMVVDRGIVKALLVVFMVVGAVSVTRVPKDLAVAGALLFALLLTRMLLGYRAWFLFLRLIIYVSLAFVSYLLSEYPPDWLVRHPNIEHLFYGVLALLVIVAVRYSAEEFFKASPLDFLVVLVVLGLGIMTRNEYVGVHLASLVVHLIILFYGAEVVLKHMVSRWNMFTLSVLFALGILAARGFG